MSTSELHGAPPGWHASSPLTFKNIDFPDFFLAGAQGDEPRAKLSTEGMKTSMTGMTPKAR